MASQDDDDLKLMRASASLLQDLGKSLPSLLWKEKPNNTRVVHQLVRLRDLDYLIQLIEPFQPEPQLLDAHLRGLVPDIVLAYLSYLQLSSAKHVLHGTTSLDVAASKILYTLCKVRGEKVIAGFLNNEPKHLDLILRALEACNNREKIDEVPWEKSYILLLWLSHLLLAPFDLASISSPGKQSATLSGLDLSPDVPSLASRVLAISIHFLGSATKEQDAASKLLVRLAIRPDMQRLHLPISLVSWALEKLNTPALDSSSSLHTFLGPLRFLVGMTVSVDSAETADLVPLIYAAGRKLMDDAMFAFLNSSAVTKKLAIKLFRNVALLTLQPASGGLAIFFESTNVLEDTIDYLLQQLGDRDTPVRFATSKALSLIILRLDPTFGYEVVQAILDSMKDDMPRSCLETDFSTVDPLQWHGLTLTLAHALFRRSASPAQLVDIVNALLLALTFEQRGATGSSIGSNVRDAACFGIWSLSRRYTTAELLSVEASDIRAEDGVPRAGNSVIQLVAVHLLLSACLDPAGNIRRGSSAALQELIGRHPDQIAHGIPLVQVVDYNAVGLRQRAAIGVAHGASSLDPLYRTSLLVALLKWRGIGSHDVASREVAAASIGRLCADQPSTFLIPVLERLHDSLLVSHSDVEYSHGTLLALSHVLDDKMSEMSSDQATDVDSERVVTCLLRSWQFFECKRPLYINYTPRSLRADVFSAVARLVTSVANLSRRFGTAHMLSDVRSHLSSVVAGLLSRSEESIMGMLPKMTQALMALDSSAKTESSLLDLTSCLSRLKYDSSSIVLQGTGRAVALAAAFPWLDHVHGCSAAEVISAMSDVVQASPAIEWRVVGVQAILLIVEFGRPSQIEVMGFVPSLHAALNDYTITERGDVGSLVRAAAIICVNKIWQLDLLSHDPSADQLLLKDITRLSLEKLDRTRLHAACCLISRGYLKEDAIITDVASIDYFAANFKPLSDPRCPVWKRDAILKGCASCAGVGAEGILRSARIALVDTIYISEAETQLAMLNSLTSLLKASMAMDSDSQPLLELLGFLLDVVTLLRSIDDFSWRNLLALVQKSHFKSNNIPKILAAVEVYRGLAGIPVIRNEVLKKLISMLRTNPYPKVRIAVAGCLYLTNGDEKLRSVDWSLPGHKYGV